MKVTSVEKKEKNTVELTIQVDAETFEAAVQKAYLKSRKDINVPGFRKGKAPRKIIESMYGSGIFYEDAINEVYPEAYEQAVKEQELDDVGYPKMEIVSAGKEGLVFTALVSVRPEVKLGEYKGISAIMGEAKITEKDIDEELKQFVERATRLVSVTRKAKKGDTAVIDFEGFDNGTPFEGGKGENYSLKLGSGSFVPGFEEQIVGMKAEEEKDIDITFPEDYVADLAGKAVVFHVKVKEVKEPQAPTLDDEFAKDVSEFETLEAFRKDLGEKLMQRREQQVKGDFESAVLEQLVEGMECEIPDGMLEVQVDHVMEEYSMRIQQDMGVPLDDYLRMTGVTLDSMRTTARPVALRRLKLQLALTAVADAENIQVNDEDMAAEIKRLAEYYSLEEEQIKEIISEEDLKRDLRLRMANDLVVSAAKPEKPKKKTTKKAAKKTEEGAEETAEAEEPKAE
ncbi:MAG: trigger factor [Clostridium sp.]|nr:trigger factor [Clostridium sp.]